MSKFERPVWPPGHPKAGRPYTILEDNPLAVNWDLASQELEWELYRKSSKFEKLALRVLGVGTAEVGFYFREPAKTEITRE